MMYVRYGTTTTFSHYIVHSTVLPSQDGSNQERTCDETNKARLHTRTTSCLWSRVKIKANKQVTSPRSELDQGETQRETAGRLISFWPLLLGVVSFFFLFLATSGWVCAISILWVSRFFRQLLSAPTTIMADYGGAYPRRSLFNLADLDSTPPVEELSLGLSSLTIVPSIDPSASSWTAGGMGGVAPISAATRRWSAFLAQRPGGGYWCPPVLSTPSPGLPLRRSRWEVCCVGGGLRQVRTCRQEGMCGRIGTPLALVS